MEQRRVINIVYLLLYNNRYKRLYMMYSWVLCTRFSQFLLFFRQFNVELTFSVAEPSLKMESYSEQLDKNVSPYRSYSFVIPFEWDIHYLKYVIALVSVPPARVIIIQCALWERLMEGVVWFEKFKLTISNKLSDTRLINNSSLLLCLRGWFREIKSV